MNKLNPFCGESSIGRLGCVSPVFSVAGEFINNDLVEELELLNNFYKFIDKSFYIILFVKKWTGK